MKYVFKMLDGECWWGGSSNDGSKAPYNQNTVLSRDFRKEASNQTMPMYLSNFGRCIWSEEPFACDIRDGAFAIEGENVTLESFGSTLKDAYVGAMNAHFSPSGAELEREFFRVPQYNTWMQMTYHQTQDGILKYARGIIENGFKPGVLIIDEGWAKGYGNWTFDPIKFPDPESMVNKLHEMGFKVMLWVVPYISTDGLLFVKNTDPRFCFEKHFLRTEDDHVAIIQWWNGYSAILDFTKDCDREFLDTQLRALMKDFGIDGFKFDGGKLECYAADSPINGKTNDDFTAAERNIAWNEFGTRYQYHEYKDTFKGGGKRSIQRIRDKNHAWDDNGLSDLIPNAITQGLLGHPFICPDMVGGGAWSFRELNLPVDQELFVRMAQCSALFPMMQFSWAPWEATDPARLSLIKAAHDLHNDFSEKILSLVADAHKNGEPILRSLEYNYPHKGYAAINDTFMLGENILVAPVIVKGQTEREVTLPEGTWLGFDGKKYAGGRNVTINVSLADLPYFERTEE